MIGKWMAVLVAVLGLTSCVFPGEGNEEEEVWYTFIFPDSGRSSELVVSEVDQDGLRIPERVTPLRSVLGEQMQGGFIADYFRTPSHSVEEYCLVEDVLIRDIATADTKVGIPAGTCFYDGPWVHPDVEEQ